MADANTIIRNLGQQVAQLTVDKAILEAEVAELRAALGRQERGAGRVTFTTLLDGGLSVKIGGVERRAVVNGLEFETTNNGDGSASFWVEVADPFNPQAQYPELVHGAPVLIDHTLAGTTTSLYAGFVLTDARAGYAGEKAIVAVECGGPLEVAKNRTDMGFIFTDADLSQWFANKRSPRAYGFDNTGRIAITTGDNVKVPYDRAGMIGAVAYLGATHLAKSAGGPLSGYRRITGTASWDLRDHLDAALLWWPSYRVALDASNYHVVKGWAANGKGSNKSFDYAFGGSDGAGYVALAMWSNKRGGTKTTDERFIELEDVVLYTDVAQKTVDQAMLAVADVLGLHSGADTETIGSVIKSLVARPYSRPGVGPGRHRRAGRQAGRVGLLRRPLPRPPAAHRPGRHPRPGQLLPPRRRGRRRPLGRHPAPRGGRRPLRPPHLRPHRQDPLAGRLPGPGHRPVQSRLGERRPLHGRHLPGDDGRLLGPQLHRGPRQADRRRARVLARHGGGQRHRRHQVPHGPRLRRRHQRRPLTSRAPTGSSASSRPARAPCTSRGRTCPSTPATSTSRSACPWSSSSTSCRRRGAPARCSCTSPTGRGG